MLLKVGDEDVTCMWHMERRDAKTDNTLLDNIKLASCIYFFLQVKGVPCFAKKNVEILNLDFEKKN